MTTRKTAQFSFQELKVWQKAVAFATSVAKAIEPVETARTHYRLTEQLEAACTNVALNTA